MSEWGAKPKDSCSRHTLPRRVLLIYRHTHTHTHYRYIYRAREEEKETPPQKKRKTLLSSSKTKQNKTMGCLGSKPNVKGRKVLAREKSASKFAEKNWDAGRNGSGIAPYVPNESLLRWYKNQLEEGKRLFNPPSVAPESIQDTLAGSGKDGKKKKKKNVDELDLLVKKGALTLYHVRPLKRVIGRGCFSTVMLADMRVHTTTANALAKGCVDVNLNSGKHLTSLSSTENDVSIEGAMLPKYLIACKEYTLEGDSAFYAYNELRKEVLRLTRLAFSTRLLKVLQMEAIYADLDEAGGHSTTQPESSSGTLKGAETVDGTQSSGRTRKSFFSRKSNNHSAGKTSRRAPKKVRIYMEYAKYGTLRNMLLSEIPRKHNKTYMHELMVRAYLREVLVALAFLHENDVVHGDLCAKNIYVVNHIKSVYATSFPAYIADLPAGRFAKVPAGWVRRVLALMDPACMQPEYDPERIGQRPDDDSVVSHVGVGQQDDGVQPNVPVDDDAPTAALNSTLEHTQNSRPFPPDSKFKKTEENNVKDSADAPESDDGQCRWVDEEVKVYLHENAYTDADNLHVLSPITTVEPESLFKSPALTGMTILRGGSFAVSPPMPILSPLLSGSLQGADAFSKLNISFNGSTTHSRSILGNYQSDDQIHRGGSEFMAPSATQSEHFEAASAMAALGRRKRRPLIKLGCYGRIRSILVGDGDNNAHKLGRVTHLAPESMQRSSFTAASDIYAFAMTFIELTTPNGAVFADLRPTDMKPPDTRQEKMDHDALWLSNISRFLLKNDNVVPLPSHLSEKCKEMLRLCLQYDPAKRPTAVELLQSQYFLLGHWVNVATKNGKIEAPWNDTNYEEAAQASGLPRLPSDTRLYDRGVFLKKAAKKRPLKKPTLARRG